MASALALHDRRTEDRHSVSLEAMIRAYRMPPRSVRLVDISGGGAMLVMDEEAPERGDEVLLVIECIEVVATVAWANDHACGLAFHRRLGACELASLRLSSH